MSPIKYLAWLSPLICITIITTGTASEPSDPESAVRRLVRANAEKDLPTLSRMMAHDADIISYGVAGRSARRIDRHAIAGQLSMGTLM